MHQKEMNSKRTLNPSISLRPTGLYQTCITTDTGKRKFFYGKTEEEVREKLQDYRNASFLGIEESEIKFKQYFAQWMIATKKDSLKPGSYDRLERTFNLYVRDRIGNTPIGQIKTFTCQLLINEYAQKYTYSTVKKIYEAINGCLKYATAIGSITRNPMAAVILPREASFAKKTKEIIIPTEEEIEKLFEVGSREFGNGVPIYNPNFVAVYRLICVTGMRLGEVLALTWDKVSFEDSTVRIDKSVSEVRNRTRKDNETKLVRVITEPKTKNGTRTIFLNEEAKQILSEVKERNEKHKVKTDFIFVNSKGKPATHHDLERTLSTLCKAAGIRPFGPHTLRHYFASRCVADGAEMLALSKHLGHSKPSITMNVYAHLTNKQDEAFKQVLSGL